MFIPLLHKLGAGLTLHNQETEKSEELSGFDDPKPDHESSDSEWSDWDMETVTCFPCHRANHYT